jgi:hypothetical protein
VLFFILGMGSSMIADSFKVADSRRQSGAPLAEVE